MIYKTHKNEILIEAENDFNPAHILECGQVFRYLKQDDGYLVFSKNKQAKIIDLNNNSQQNVNKQYYKIITNDVEYFVNYFDLKTDYLNIKNKLLSIEKTREVLSKAIEFGSGIRILNQDYFEAIISFIISQNNNIKRIQKIIEQICQKYGTNMGEYYAFPSPSQLEKATKEQLENLGAGYRASYILEAVKKFGECDFDIFTQKSIEEMEKELLSVNGIGQKVCDCVMLFGFHKMNYFPVDTWNEKVYQQYFASDYSKQDAILNKKIDRVVMRNRFVEIFKENSGYAQQYLFYYARTKK